MYYVWQKVEALPSDFLLNFTLKIISRQFKQYLCTFPLSKQNKNKYNKI